MRITIIDKPNPEGKQPHKKGFVTIGEEEYSFAAWPARSGQPGVYTGTIEPKGDKAP